MTPDVPAAIQAVFVDHKQVPARSVVQLIVEVPIENHDRAVAALGGMPLQGALKEVAVAKMVPAEETDPRAELEEGEVGAIGAVFAAQRTVQTRSVSQLILEVPEGLGEAAVLALGGTPRPGVQRYVAIARIQPPDVKPIAQAGIACKEERFQRFILGASFVEGMKDLNAAATIAHVRRRLGIASRAELATNEAAKLAWTVLYAKSREAA